MDRSGCKARGMKAPLLSSLPLLLLLPFAVVSFLLTVPFVVKSWQVFEGSKETGGIRGIFILKTVVLVWAVLLALQGIALALRALGHLRGESPTYSADSRTGPAGT